MNFLVAPPSHRNDGPPEDGEVDRLLRAFYRSERPDPWPAFTSPTPRARQPILSRSRLALAASVALLVAGLGFLSGKFSTDAVEPSGTRVLDVGATHVLPGSTMPRGSGVQFKGPFIDVKPNDAGELKIIIEEVPTGK